MVRLFKLLIKGFLTVNSLVGDQPSELLGLKRTSGSYRTFTFSGLKLIILQHLVQHLRNALRIKKNYDWDLALQFPGLTAEPPWTSLVTKLS